VYERIDSPATSAQKELLMKLAPEQLQAQELAGEPIVAIHTRAPGNDAPIGGLKVSAENGWFAVRPSGTEEIYKLYAESFLGPDHLKKIQQEAREMVGAVFEGAGLV
jgi:phosphoglucomutase